jgi:hypothetical protein
MTTMFETIQNVITDIDTKVYEDNKSSKLVDDFLNDVNNMKQKTKKLGKYLNKEFDGSYDDDFTLINDQLKSMSDFLESVQEHV